MKKTGSDPFVRYLQNGTLVPVEWPATPFLLWLAHRMGRKDMIPYCVMCDNVAVRRRRPILEVGGRSDGDQEFLYSTSSTMIVNSSKAMMWVRS